MTPLRLDKSSVSNGESNGQRNDASDQSSPVSDDDTLINGVGSERGHGGGEGSNGGGLLALELTDRFRGIAHGKSNVLARGVDRGESRSNGRESNQEKGDLLVGLHFVILDIGCRRKISKEEMLLLVMFESANAIKVVNALFLGHFVESTPSRALEIQYMVNLINSNHSI